MLAEEAVDVVEALLEQLHFLLDGCGGPGSEGPECCKRSYNNFRHFFFTNGGVLQHLHSTENDPMQYASSEMNTLGHASF